MEVEVLNEQHNALSQATSTTVKDVALTKLKAKSPTTFANLLDQVKRFGNLLFAIFGHRCPLLVEIHDLLNNLNEYSETARKTPAKKTIATILWILHLQSRYFVSVQMDGDRKLIVPYKYMINCVRKKYK